MEIRKRPITDKALLIIIFYLTTTNLFAQVSRDFESVDLQLVDEINLSEFEVFGPTGLSLDSNGTIILFDNQTKHILKSSINKIREWIPFTSSKGRGPGEFQNVWTTDIDDNEIYVAAIENRKISKWSLNGEMLTEYPIRTKYVFPIRMAVCSGNNYIYVLSRQYWRNGILHLYDKEGNHSRSFGKISGRDEQHIFYNEGYLECDENGNLYHSLMYVNEIRKYSPEGDLLLKEKVYGDLENKEVIEKDGRWIDLHSEAKTIGGNIQYLNNKLFVAYSGIRPRRFTTIDVYSSDDIEYQYSIEMPVQFRNFAINNNNIVTLDKHRQEDDVWLRIYSYQSNENK